MGHCEAQQSEHKHGHKFVCISLFRLHTSQCSVSAQCQALCWDRRLGGGQGLAVTSSQGVTGCWRKDRAGREVMPSGRARVGLRQPLWKLLSPSAAVGKQPWAGLNHGHDSGVVKVSTAAQVGGICPRALVRAALRLGCGRSPGEAEGASAGNPRRGCEGSGELFRLLPPASCPLPPARRFPVNRGGWQKAVGREWRSEGKPVQIQSHEGIQPPGEQYLF